MVQEGLGYSNLQVIKTYIKYLCIDIYQQNIHYSYDSRTGDPGNKGLWSEPEAFGERAVFQVDKSPAVLSIKNLTKEDGGVYTCR